MGTVLVTGGAGFLGKFVACSLAGAGHDVLITYRRSFRCPEVLTDLIGTQVQAVRCDVMDLPELSRIVRDHTVESIVHLANMSNYEGTVYQTMQTNIRGTINVLEAAALGSLKKVTYVSSNSIAGFGSTADPEDETVPIVSGATNVIAPSKKIGEILTLFYGATFGISTAVVRPGLIYGPYTETEIGGPGVVRTILETLFAGKPVDLPKLGRNEPVRMTYVRDVAAAITLVHLAGRNQHRVYAVDAEIPTTWGEVQAILKELVPGCSIRFGPGIDESESRPSKGGRNIVSEFAFQPNYGIREGLRETVEWFRNGQR